MYDNKIFNFYNNYFKSCIKNIFYLIDNLNVFTPTIMMINKSLICLRVKSISKIGVNPQIVSKSVWNYSSKYVFFE